MWEVIGIIAAVVVIMLFLQLMDFTEVLKNRLRGGTPSVDFETSFDTGLESKLADIDRRLADIEAKLN